MEKFQKNNLKKIIELLNSSANNIIVLGAGMSVESGIPTFRGKNGLWTKYGVPKMDSYKKFINNPEEWWNNEINMKMDKYIYELRHKINVAKPHNGHYIISKLEKLGMIQGVITQNIDNLDHKAGIKNLIEIHGNRTKFRCIECEKTFDRNEIIIKKPPKNCPKCNGIVKFDTVMFGEPIPKTKLDKAKQLFNQSKVILAIGTSATVRPISGLFWIAQKEGKKIIDINPNETNLKDISILNLKINAKRFLEILEKEIMK